MINTKGLTFFILSVLLLASSALAQVTLPDPLGGQSLQEIIANVVQYIVGILAGIAVIMFIWAGILFLTSAGNEARITTAKKVLIYAVIGLGIAIAGEGLIILVVYIICGSNGCS